MPTKRSVRVMRTNTPVAVGIGLVALDVVLTDDKDQQPRYFAGGTRGNVLTILRYLGWRSNPVARLSPGAAADCLLDDLKTLGGVYGFRHEAAGWEHTGHHSSHQARKQWRAVPFVFLAMPVLRSAPAWVQSSFEFSRPALVSKARACPYGAKKRPRLGRCWSSLPSSLRLCRLRCSSSSSRSLAG